MTEKTAKEQKITQLRKLTAGEIIKKYPYIKSFFEEQKFSIDKKDLTLHEIYEELPIEEKDDLVHTPEELLLNLVDYIENMQEFLGEKDNKVNRLSLLPGKDKEGRPEEYEEINIKSGEIISVVGPTGSGKSRLLADIEWAARGDTPTGRKILINGEDAEKDWRLSGEKKLVAQLSQNMNFVMDLPVNEFLHLHAASRLVENEEKIVARIIEKANELAGESFAVDSQITSLSGGQSRALMIADTAILSSSPIILIDEIENAGIDRAKALDLLVGEEKIVLMATHDPILALMGNRRIVVNNGGIVEVLKISQKEKSILAELQQVDQRINKLREELRYGYKLNSF